VDIAKLLYILLGILVVTVYVLVEPSISDNVNSQSLGVNPVVAQFREDIINSTILSDANVFEVANASYPTIHIDPLSNSIYLAYLKAFDNGSADVYLSRSLDYGETFTEPIKVNNIGKASIPDFPPYKTVGSGEQKYIEFEDVRVPIGVGGEIKEKYSPIRVATGNDNRTLYLVWKSTDFSRSLVDEGYSFGKSNITLAKSTDGGKSFEEKIIDNTNNSSSKNFFEISLDDNKNVYLTWINSSFSDIQYGADSPLNVTMGISEDQGTTFDYLVVDDMPSYCDTISSVYDGLTEKIYLSWRDLFNTDRYYLGINRETAVSEYDIADKNITRYMMVDNQTSWFPGECPGAGSDLVIDKDGVLNVAWFSGTSQGPGIYLSKLNNNSNSFSKPVPVFASESYVPPISPILGVDDNNTIWIVWENKLVKPSAIAIAMIEDRRNQARIDNGQYPIIRDLEFDIGSLPSMELANNVLSMAWMDGDNRTKVISKILSK
jgi:hypothetical protein